MSARYTVVFTTCSNEQRRRRGWHQVLQDPMSLFGHAATHHSARRRIERNLTGREQKPARPNRLTVGTDGGRCLRTGDGLTK
jgi:hypothetical protein